MNPLTEAIISLAELAEAEGRLLKRRAIQTVIVIITVCSAAFFIVLAFGLFLLALFNHLSLYFEPSIVWLIEGITALTIAGVLVWIAVKINQKP